MSRKMFFIISVNGLEMEKDGLKNLSGDFDINFFYNKVDKFINAIDEFGDKCNWRFEIEIDKENEFIAIRPEN